MKKVRVKEEARLKTAGVSIDCKERVLSQKETLLDLDFVFGP